MITWMQKHKKWLVVTIWISAIAFIGAGMVNWGSYGFGTSNDKVARVGEIDIRIPDYQRVYNNVLREYAQIPQLGGILDEAQAKQLGIPQIALERVIQQTQLLNFARDLGLRVSDDEVGQEILHANVYVDENGHFSQDVYKAALKEMHISTNEFEENIRNALLIEKVFTLMNANPALVPTWFVTPLERQTIQLAYGISDRLMVKSIPISQIRISATDDELKAFWELNANNWKTPMEFEIEYILVPFSEQHPDKEALREHYENFKSDYLDESGHLMSMEQAMDRLTYDVQKVEAERIAKREYRDLRNGSKSGITRTIKEDEGFFVKRGIDLVVADIKAAHEGQVLKPIEADEGFVILKVLHKKESVNKRFEEAKSAVKEQYIRQKTKDGLVALAQESVKDFKGIDIGFVDRFYKGTILALNDTQKAHFLSQVFSSQALEGYVLFDDQAVLYRVLEQSYKINNQADDITMSAKNMKFQVTFDALVEYLHNTYKTTIYIDVTK